VQAVFQDPQGDIVSPEIPAFPEKLFKNKRFLYTFGFSKNLPCATQIIPSGLCGGGP
jgi:hypothetical protein